jgi:macrolide-specific efflux system membrane fusion protein
MSSEDNKTQPDNWEIQTVRKQDISSSVSATGIIKPQVGAEVRIGTRASGTVTDLHVNIGDYVQKGQLLAEIDASELKAKLNQALANLKYAETTLKYAKLEFKRMEKLNAKEYVSQQVLEEAKKAVEIAESQVIQEESNVDYITIQLSYTKVNASISGVVGSVSTQEGETVSATFSAPTFVTIIDLDQLEVWAYIDETDIGRIEIGQAVTFTVDTYTETEFSGIVTAIYPKAEIQNNVVNYITIIKIQNQEEKILRPEMTASVNIWMQKHENVITIPAKALIRKNEKYYVSIMQDGQAIEQEVKTGLRQNSYVEILEGLNETEKIIISK